MRVARFSVLLPLVFVSAVSAPHSLADPASTAAADSTSPPVAPPRSRCISDEVLIMPPHAAVLDLGHGRTIKVKSVGPWSVDAIRFETMEGETGYLSFHQVHRIVGADGRDRTRDVLDQRKTMRAGAILISRDRMLRDSVSTAGAPRQLPRAATISLSRGDSVEAAYVGPWSVDAVRAWTVDGKTRYLPHHRVRAVTDAEGRDRTRDVIEGRMTIGIACEDCAPSHIEWSFRPFHGWSFDDRRAYVITEWSILNGDVGMREGRSRMVVSVGGMRNLSRQWAVGGVLQLSEGAEASYRDVGVGFRVKRAVAGAIDLDVTSGVFTPGNDGWNVSGVPFFSETALSVTDALALVARFENVHYTVHSIAWEPFEGSRTIDGTRNESNWSIGARIGSSPRWLSVPGLVVGLLWFFSSPAPAPY